jgi:hypothetical protein
VADHPQQIILCDLPGSTGRLSRLARGLRDDLGYGGRVEIVESGEALPEAVYRAGLIVAATSTPNVLDVERLAAGTVVVDDSFPPCFETGRALARMESRGDVLLVGGGLLDCGPVRRTISVPEAAPPAAERIGHLFPSVGVASCQLEALLWAREPDLPLTLGMVNLDTARRYWTTVEAAGLRSAPLHLGSYLPAEKLLSRVRRIIEAEVLPGGPWIEPKQRPATPAKA